MKEKEFDNLIRARLKDYESPVSTSMWERIALAGNKRKRGASARLYLLTVVLLLIGFVGFYYSSTTRGQTKKDIASKNDITKNGDKKDLIQSSNKADGSASNLNLANYDGAGQPDKAIRTRNRRENHPMTKTDQKRKKTADDPQGVSNSDDDALRDNNDESPGDAHGGSDNNLTKKAKDTTSNQAVQEDNAEMKPSEYESDRFSVELVTSPAVPINEISSDNKAYEQALKSASTMQLSYTVGTRFSYSISKRLSAKIGVQYSQVNEKVNFTDPAGNNFASTNHYRNIGVPLVMGYKIVSVNNLHISVNTGIILNVVSKYEGIIPSGSGQPIDIKNENVYNTNASADLYLGVNLSKKMNTRTDFFAEPWMSYRFKNMVSHYYSFDQKINTLGLSLGLRYRLYKDEKHQ